MTHTRALRTVWITARAWRDRTRVSPALVTPPEGRSCGASPSFADPGHRRRSPGPSAVTPATGLCPTPGATPTSMQSP